MLKFLERYGKENYMVAAVNRKFFCITDMIDHVVAQSVQMYAGTPEAGTFMISMTDSRHGGRKNFRTIWSLSDSDTVSYVAVGK